MQRSTERVLTTHTGSLPRPDDLIRMMYAKEEGVPVDKAALADMIVRCRRTHAQSPARASTADAAAAEILAGKRACFTGESICSQGGATITRELAAALAEGAGMEISDSVTKKLDILVVADPHTQSGKARKARQYGKRIIHEPVLWQMLGVAID